MKHNTGWRRLAFVLIYIAFSGCSVDKVFQDPAHTSQGTNADANLEEPSRINSSPQDDETIVMTAPIDEPIMTGGAFLSCQLVASSNAEQPGQEVGCRFEEDGTRIAPPESYEVTLTLWHQSNDSSELISSSTSNEEFDWIFSLELDDLDEVRIGATVRDRETGLISEFRTRIERDSAGNETSQDLTLTAFKAYKPKEDTEANHQFSTPTTVSIPSRIEVVMGNAGNHRTELFFNNIKCDYVGGASNKSPMAKMDEDDIKRGMFYHFDKCNDLSPGDNLTVTSIRMRISNGDRYAPTKVIVDIPIITDP